MERVIARGVHHPGLVGLQRGGDAARDHDDLGIETVDDERDHRAQRAARLGDDGARGGLLDPTYLLANLLPVLAVLALIVVGKAVTKLVIVLAAGYAPKVALTVAAGLAQIGEFSFIVGTVGRSLGLLPDEGYQLIVAGSLLSITINPLLFALITPLEASLRRNRVVQALTARRAGELTRLRPEEREALRLHAIICGYGRVGRLIGPALARRGFRFVVVTQQRDEIDRLRSQRVTAIYGDAANHVVLDGRDR